MTPIKALLISGSARASTTLIAVVRTKIIAVLLGPEGIGLLGLLTSVQEVGAQVADGGMSHSGVRQLARARNTPGRLARIRLAMAVAVGVLACLAAAVFWAFHLPLSEVIMGTADHAKSFGLLGLGIAVLMLYRWRQTLLCGMQRVASHSGLTISAATVGAVLGVSAVVLWGMDGLVWAVLVPPMAGVLLAPLFTRGLAGRPLRANTKNFQLASAHGQILFKFGIGLMLSALAVLITPMILRIFLSHQAGLEQVGLFQAGLVLTLHLTAVITAAVAMDYYPRLSAVAGSPKETEALMNKQALLHLMIGAPAALCVAITAPNLLQALFSEAFVAATSLVQWMMIGAVARLIAVPAEMVLMARAQSGAILRLQIAHQSCVLAVALTLWPHLGLASLGIAYSLGQVLHLAMLTLWNQRDSGTIWRFVRQTPSPYSPAG